MQEKFVKYIIKNDLPNVIDMIPHVDLNKMTKSGVLPVVCATAHDDILILKAIIDAGANIDKPDYQHCTALIEAVMYGNKNAVEFLINKDCNTEAIDVFGMNALNWAHRLGYVQISEIINSR